MWFDWHPLAPLGDTVGYMVRRVLLGVVVLLLLLPTTANALTIAQVQRQGSNAADDLSTGLGMKLAFNGAQDVEVRGTASECRKTSRKRGACDVEAQANTGDWCVGTAVVRQDGRRITRAVRDVQCGDVSARLADPHRDD